MSLIMKHHYLSRTREEEVEWASNATGSSWRYFLSDVYNLSYISRVEFVASASDGYKSIGAYGGCIIYVRKIHDTTLSHMHTHRVQIVNTLDSPDERNEG